MEAREPYTSLYQEYLLDKAEKEKERYDFPIVDVDAHHLDIPPRELAEYMDEPWRRRVKEMVRNRIFPDDLGERRIERRAKRPKFPGKNNTTGTDVVYPYKKAMDKLGFDYSIAFSTAMLSLGLHPQEEFEAAFALGYARWITERVLPHESKIKSMLYLPFNDPDASVRLVEEFGDKDGVVGFMVTSVRHNPVHHKDYMQLYSMLQERHLPIAFHSISHWREPQFRLLNNFLSTHALGFPFYNMLHMVNIVINGLPERFPGLKWIFLEAGIAWLPFIMQRMDTMVMMRSSEAPLLRKLPSEYVTDFYYSSQPMETPDNPDHLAAILEMIKANTQLLYSSDYPHWDFDLPSMIYDLPFLDLEAKKNILGGNALRLFDLADPLTTQP